MPCGAFSVAFSAASQHLHVVVKRTYSLFRSTWGLGLSRVEASHERWSSTEAAAYDLVHRLLIMQVVVRV